MKTISSAQNQTIKDYAKLQGKKFRDESGLFAIEGDKNIVDSLKALGASEIEAVLASNAKAQELLHCFPQLDDKLIVADEAILKKVSSLESQSNAVLIARQRDFSRQIDADCLVYLDRIRDPGNLGTIIRTAVACDYGVLLDDCCDVYNPKVTRSCMSALAKAKISYASPEILHAYSSCGYKIVGADMSGDNVFDMQRASLKRFVLVIGSEADGISQSIKNSCHQIVALPMQNMESLNASVAAGVLMFEFKHRIFS